MSAQAFWQERAVFRHYCYRLLWSLFDTWSWLIWNPTELQNHTVARKHRLQGWCLCHPNSSYLDSRSHNNCDSLHRFLRFLRGERIYILWHQRLRWVTFWCTYNLLLSLQKYLWLIHWIYSPKQEEGASREDANNTTHVCSIWLRTLPMKCSRASHLPQCKVLKREPRN